MSVNEDDRHSDRITAAFLSYGGFNRPSNMLISVGATRKFTVSKVVNGIAETLEFQDIDLDGLIQYLQDAKVFLSEEDMVKKLMGKLK